MKQYLSILCICAGIAQIPVAQDSIVVISRMSNTQFTTHLLGADTVVVISTLGQPFGGIYEQNGLVISFEPFAFFPSSGPSATHDLPAITDLNVYPNPATDYAILQRDETTDPYILRLYSTDGSLLGVHTWEAGTEVFQLFLEGYPHGAYILTVSDEKLTKANQYRILIQ